MKSRLIAIAWAAASAAVPSLASDAKTVAEAERMAAAAVASSASQPEPSLRQALKALELTVDFEPTAFVTSGRKGELVEDTYLAARAAYRRHRARVYNAVGRCHAAAGRHAVAARYLRRAVALEPTVDNANDLARSLIGAGRAREALDVVLGASGAPGAEALALAQQAADAVGLPSLQLEIDRRRLMALPAGQRPELRDGPFRLPERTRLSTGVVPDLQQDGLAILYSADASCRSCSADLEMIHRAARGARVLVSGPSAELDRPLRQALALYGYDWPVIVGGGAERALSLGAPSMLLLARRGLLGALLKPPFLGLPAAAEALSKADVSESLPRAQWNRRPVDRRALAPPPGLLPEGLAPGDDEPAPEAFAAAVAAYRSGRFQEARQLFERLEGAGDGWLLPPEARLDRALCLIGLGQRERARQILLKTGDSRFQDDVDRALERAGSPSGTAFSSLADPGREHD